MEQYAAKIEQLRKTEFSHAASQFSKLFYQLSQSLPLLSSSPFLLPPFPIPPLSPPSPSFPSLPLPPLPSLIHALPGTTYLDHAGTTLYSRCQLQAHIQDLTTSLYGNPHSHNPSSRLTTDSIDHVRELVLRHFGTDLRHYDVIFTSGCTAALKMLAEAFPWSKGEEKEEEEKEEEEVMYIGDVMVEHGFQRSGGYGQSVFCYLEDNHTSVLGMREIAARGGARLVCVSPDALRLKEGEQTLSKNHAQREGVHLNGLLGNGATSSSSSSSSSPPFHLFVYPAQSNFNGRKYPLSWVSGLPQGRLIIPGHALLEGEWLVALDAAALVSTSPLDLSDCHAHFVTISFYKIFGFPTGLGALLVRRDCAWLLGEKEKGKGRRYFGGGTVLASIASQRFHIPRPQTHERYGVCFSSLSCPPSLPPSPPLPPYLPPYPPTYSVLLSLFPFLFLFLCRLEDGTVPFLDILALRHGFEALESFGLSPASISHHTFHLAQYTYNKMAAMRHSNGRPVCLLYHQEGLINQAEQGGVVTFNVVRPDGSFVGYSEVCRRGGGGGGGVANLDYVW